MLSNRAVAPSRAASSRCPALPAAPRPGRHCARPFGPLTSRPSVSLSAAGGGVADATTIKPSPVHEKSSEGVLRKQPIFKVLLHNDNHNRREYVVNVLISSIEGLSKDEATECMREAHDTGVSMVVACPMEEAEKYCEKLRLNGLCSTIEPGC